VPRLASPRRPGNGASHHKAVFGPGSWKHKHLLPGADEDPLETMAVEIGGKCSIRRERATSMKKATSGQAEAPAIPQKSDFDGVIAAPFGHDLAQTHRFPRTLVETPAVLAVPRAPGIGRPFGQSLCGYCPLAEESDDRHRQSLSSSGFCQRQEIAAVAFEKSGIERRLIESLLAGDGA